MDKYGLFLRLCDGGAAWPRRPVGGLRIGENLPEEIHNPARSYRMWISNFVEKGARFFPANQEVFITAEFETKESVFITIYHNHAATHQDDSLYMHLHYVAAEWLHVLGRSRNTQQEDQWKRLWKLAMESRTAT